MDGVVYPPARNAMNAVDQPLSTKAVDVTNSMMFEAEESKTTEDRVIDSLAREYFTSIPMGHSLRIPLELIAEGILLLGIQNYLWPEVIVRFSIKILHIFYEPFQNTDLGTERNYYITHKIPRESQFILTTITIKRGTGTHFTLIQLDKGGDIYSSTEVAISKMEFTFYFKNQINLGCLIDFS